MVMYGVMLKFRYILQLNFNFNVLRHIYVMIREVIKGLSRRWRLSLGNRLIFDVERLQKYLLRRRRQNSGTKVPEF